MTMEKLRVTLRWAPRASLRRLRGRGRGPRDLIIAIADHFEPSILPENPSRWADISLQEQRLEGWCRELPRALEPWRDHEGVPVRHTYFFPAEQYHRGLVERLAAHCHAGWGEVEIHLHHGIERPDTAASTRRQLLEFRDILANQHGCLSRWQSAGEPRYAFVHGNWALANSCAGRFCGVDEEMQILAETGCYADLTLPSAPSPAQIAKTNALYECGLPLECRAPHRRGRSLRRGRAPRVFPLMLQGPLGLRWGQGGPKIENGELSGKQPPTAERFAYWRRTGISVQGQPAWVFIKLHCHGMDPRDQAALWGRPMQAFLAGLTAAAEAGGDRLHFVTAREMANIALAACDGRDGNAGEYRNYRLQPIRGVQPGEAQR